MAQTNQGILGPFNGTIGPVTGYTRNGQNIMRTSSSRVRYKYTALRTAQLEKIKVCTRFTKAFSGSGFLNKSFPAYGNTGNGYNRATSVIMSRAVTGDYPAVKLSYPLIMVSKGKLPAAVHAAAAPMEGGNIYFSFTDNSDMGIASSYDTIILVAYAPQIQQAVFTLKGGMRKDCEAVLNAAALKGSVVETWMGYLSSDEKDASYSVYTGRVIL